MRMLRPGHLIALAILVLGCAVAFWGGLARLDDALRDARFLGGERAPSGETVFVDIDARSLEVVGVWPWPRRIHADILDRLMEMGAAEVAFDVDFSTTSTPADDALLEAALERAGGYALLAAFRQRADASGAAAYNLPLSRFRRHADPVAVNVELGTGGVVRAYPQAVMLGDTAYRSLAAVLAGSGGVAGTDFLIDYSIDPALTDRVPVADLLAGRVAPERIANRQVIVGASALELRDVFLVPVHGVLPGAMVQLLATETLRQGRVLVPLGPWPSLALLLLAGAALLVAARRTPLAGVVLAACGMSVGIEALALLLQVHMALLLDTAAVQVTLIALLLAVVGSEIVRVRRLHGEAARERDAVRVVLDHVIADNFDGVVVVNQAGEIVAASNLAEELLGDRLRGQQALGTLPAELAGAIDLALTSDARQLMPPVESELPRRHGEVRSIEYAVTVSVMTAGQAGSHGQRVACLTFRDITERRRSEARLHYLATHDPLTGALSRTQLAETIAAEVAQGEGGTHGVSVVVLDLRRFKAVNDTLGHSFGDEVLRQVAERLCGSGADAVARLGGDSFALMLRGRRPAAELRSFGADLLQRLTEPYQLPDNHHAIIAASAGGTHSGLSGTSAETLLGHADMALSAAKALPGSRFEMFRAEFDARLKEKRDMEVALQHAIEREEFSLRYQPQVAFETGALLGVEALVRWEHPQLGQVSPGKFIAAAEETAQIIPIGRWVLRQACREVVSWPGEVRLAVNFSPIQFELVDVVAEVRAALAESGLPAERLDIEITEGLFLSNADYVSGTLERLRALGCRIALDDFGTGYSSLNYLGRLPVDKLKIDRSFVSRLPDDPEATAIVEAVLKLSAALGKVVVAEGMETAEQARALQQMGCPIGQGYFFSKPLTAAELLRWADKRAAAERLLAV